MKISLHVEADSIGEYQQAICALAGNIEFAIEQTLGDATKVSITEGEPNTQDATEKRKRRTKAEIAAEEAAELAAKANIQQGLTVSTAETNSQATTGTTAPLAEKETTLDDLRALVLPINTSSPVAKKAVQEIIAATGATNFSTIPLAKFDEVKAKFLELAENLGIDLSAVTV